MAAEKKPKQKKLNGSSVRIDLSSEDYDDLMDWSEHESRSIRGQASFLVLQGLRQWRESNRLDSGGKK